MGTANTRCIVAESGSGEKAGLGETKMSSFRKKEQNCNGGWPLSGRPFLKAEKESAVRQYLRSPSSDPEEGEARHFTYNTSKCSDGGQSGDFFRSKGLPGAWVGAVREPPLPSRVQTGRSVSSSSVLRPEASNGILPGTLWAGSI